MKDDVDLLDGLEPRLADARDALRAGPGGGRRVARGRARRGGRPRWTDELDALELRSLFSGEHDERDAVCEVHSGAGGTDAQDWAEMMLRMYLRWAERRGFTVELDEVVGRAGGRHHVGHVHRQGPLRLRAADGGEGRAPAGAHLAVRLASPAARRPSPRFEAVPFLEDASDEVEIDEKDLRIDTYRSSGAGGQHVNVTDSAVRITHLPTGIVVVVPERAQPAPEQGRGHADPRRQAGRAGPRGAPQGARRASPASSARSPGAARSAPTCWSRTRWSRTCAPSTRSATSRRCSTATSTSSWRRACAGGGEP